VEPTSRAKYVKFVTVNRPSEMPGLRSDMLDWPYTEGLRIDEAMHPLTLLTVGMYGQTLANQNGAPVRMIVPWKYGFKSGKSIVRIEFVEKQPVTAWAGANPREYGFYSNVNPEVDHPRWTQKRERLLPDFFASRDTEKFNGYGEQVASLYSGMDLKVNY
jgi:sulfoxide reductase catalytic subunit YedY